MVLLSTALSVNFCTCTAVVMFNQIGLEEKLQTPPSTTTHASKLAVLLTITIYIARILLR